MGTRRLLLLCLWIILVARCKEKTVEPADAGQYYVVNNIQGAGFPTGNISTYKIPDALIVDEAFKLSAKSTSEWVADAIVSSDKLYIARAISSTVEIVGLADLNTIHSVNYGETPTGNYYRHIEVSQNRLIVSDRAFLGKGTLENESFLKIIHLDNLDVVDSVPIIRNAAIWALASANGRIFVSAGDQTQSIFVIDAATSTKIGEIGLAGICAEMLVDKDENILAFTRTKMLKISSEGLFVIREWNLPSAQINLKPQFATTCNDSHALDREANIIYFLGVAAQPASAPYLLYSYDLNTEVATLLDANFMSGETISFDQKNRRIVIGDIQSQGGGGSVRVLTPQGLPVSQFILKNIPSKILIQP